MNYNLNERLKTDDISDILNKKPLTREDYIQKFEAAYNFGPPSFPPQVFIEFIQSLSNEYKLYCYHHPLTYHEIEYYFVNKKLYKD